jgi:hypothetical protein
VPYNVRDDTPIIVTFLNSGIVDLSSRGIDEAQAADLRARLTAFAEEWDSPEMDIYDNMESVDIARRHTLGLKESNPDD